VGLRVKQIRFPILHSHGIQQHIKRKERTACLHASIGAHIITHSTHSTHFDIIADEIEGTNGVMASLPAAVLADVFERYSTELQTSFAMDTEDVLTEVRELLTSHTDALTACREVSFNRKF
jgi:hypothetical protein